MDKQTKSKIRLKILQLFNWIPDETMVRLQYWMKTGRKLNLTNPARFTEKIQWYKLFYRDPLMAKCADKYEVREYIERKGYGHILNKCYGVYNSISEINFDELPDKFVIKSTNGASGLGLKICQDKSKLDIAELEKEFAPSLKREKNGDGREWVYYKYPPRLIVEEFLEPGKNEKSLAGYKFFCFNGEPYCLYAMNDRFEEGGVRQSIFDLDFNRMPYMRKNLKPVESIKKPENFDEMLEVVRALSKDFPYVRADFYNIDGKIYFGELTFFPESGYYSFEPDEFDFILGEKFVLPEKIKVIS